MKIDLHTHSTASDGRLSPAALIKAAGAAGLGAIALTDHDTVDGLEEAETAAAEIGIRFIRGVELEIDWSGRGLLDRRDCHLLGLGFDCPSPRLRQILFQLRHKRERRNRLILAKMNAALGLNATLEEVRGVSGITYVGRPHFAEYLIRKNVVKGTEEAFRKYLGRGKPFFVPKGGVRLRRAISAIKESGGITILAHPTSLYLAWGKLPEVLEQFKRSGLDGIEGYHPIASRRSTERLLEMARAGNFYISAGSDFHGEARTDRNLGCGPGGDTITSQLVSFPQSIMKQWKLDEDTDEQDNKELENPKE